MVEPDLQQLEAEWFTQEDIEIITKLLKSGQLNGFWNSFEGSPYIRSFEMEFSRYLGCKDSISVTSGTVAIHVSLLACGVKPGDLVAVSPYTHIGSVAPILMCGARPVFVDLEPNGFNISPGDLGKVMRDARGSVKAIIAAHQLGHPCDMEPILELASQFSVPVIEDAAQALGAEYRGRKTGTIGKVGCFAIGGDMTKLVSTGEGGMITTNDEEIAARCRNLRNHGEKLSGCDYLCYNYRLSALQAIVGLVQMKRLDFYLDWQVRNARHLTGQLPNSFTGPPEDGRSKPAYLIIGCEYDEKKAGMNVGSLLNLLKESGFATGDPRRNVGPGYSKLIYQIPFYSRFTRRCPIAERKVETDVWFDWHRYPITQYQVDRLIVTLRKICR